MKNLIYIMILGLLSSCGTSEENEPPIAVMSSSGQTAMGQMRFVNESFDPDGEIVSHVWYLRIPDGYTGIIETDNEIRIDTFIEGYYAVILVVTDNDGAESKTGFGWSFWLN